MKKFKKIYKGYIGYFEIDGEIIRGRVINCNDVITYHGKTIKETVEEFRISVDDYLLFCKELGTFPDRMN